MTFKNLQTNKSGPSPAVKLHSRYNSLTIGRSRVNDWKLLLQRGYSFAEAESLISYLETHRYAALPSSATIVRHSTALFAEAKKDPVASRVPVSHEANDLWEQICCAGAEIDPEYVADALNRYRDYLKTNPKELAYLEPPIDFVYDWFVRIAKYGSPRTRLFHLEHPKWVQHVTLVKRAMERG